MLWKLQIIINSCSIKFGDAGGGQGGGGGQNYKGSASHVVNIKISLPGGENRLRILNKDITVMWFTF